MTGIDESISELLYDHDCVIVPSLGGFLASYAGASVHAGTHTLYPPSRKVAFNVFLQKNDGLLANHISGRRRLPYTEALRIVEKYASECRQELDKGLRVYISGVGMLYQDAERNLQFEPDPGANFLADSFGLEPIRHLPLSRTSPSQPVLRVPDAIRPSVRPERKKSGSLSKRVVSLFLITGAIAWMGVNVFVVLKDKNLASLKQPVSSPAPVEQAVSNEASVRPQATETTAAIIPLPETISVQQDEVAVKEESPAADKKKNYSENEIQQPAKTAQPAAPAVAATQEQSFFVIAGAFKIASNAASLVDNLHRQGFADARIVESDHPLTLVCFSGYATRREANDALDSLKGSSPDGWVYKNTTK